MDGVADLVQSAADMSDEKLYEYDFPAWCERQSERLRRLAANAMGADQPDWPRVIEEVEDMGAAQRRQVESLLVQAILHLDQAAHDAEWPRRSALDDRDPWILARCRARLRAEHAPRHRYE